MPDSYLFSADRPLSGISLKVGTVKLLQLRNKNGPTRPLFKKPQSMIAAIERGWHSESVRPPRLVDFAGSGRTPRCREPKRNQADILRAFPIVCFSIRSCHGLRKRFFRYQSDFGPEYPSSGWNPRNTATSAHFVTPSSACNSYGFAICLSWRVRT